MVVEVLTRPNGEGGKEEERKENIFSGLLLGGKKKGWLGSE